MRLSELWERCQRGQLTMDEFFELSALITEVNGITGSLCVDCAMLDRPNVSSNWALATTTLCRGHLRFRLGYARIDGGGAPHRCVAGRPTRESPTAPHADGQNGAVTLAARVYAASHLTGTFVLRSGRTADHYFDKYRFESDPALLADIVRALAPLVPEGTEGLAGLELGGVPLATMLSSRDRAAGVLRAQGAEEVRHRAHLRGRRGRRPPPRDH